MKMHNKLSKRILAIILALGLSLSAFLAYEGFHSTDRKFSGIGCVPPRLPLLKSDADPENNVTEHMIDAPFIDQTQSYPTGCESVSTAMALNYLGIDIDTDTFIDSYLDLGQAPFYTNDGVVGDSPREYFLGSPYDRSGWGCYSPVIEKALNKFIDKRIYSVKRLSGKDLESLCKGYINNDIPVIMWATIDMQEAYTTTTWTTSSDETFTWTAPEHCLLLVGYDEKYYYFNDPLNSKQTRYKKSAVAAAYESLGEQAIVITRNENMA